MKKMRRKELNKAQERWDEAHDPMLDHVSNGINGVANGDARLSRDGLGRSSHERLTSTTGLVPSVPAAMMKIKKRGDYDQLEQDDHRDR